MNPVFMNIEGVEFKFTFHAVGWSYAEVKVRTKSKFLGFIPYWKCLWSTSNGFGWGSALALHVQKAHKREIERWCENALKEYLSYTKSWSDK